MLRFRDLRVFGPYCRNNSLNNQRNMVLPLMRRKRHNTPRLEDFHYECPVGMVPGKQIVNELLRSKINLQVKGRKILAEKTRFIISIHT